MRTLIAALSLWTLQGLAVAKPEARVAMKAATETALAQVAGGVVKSSELEREHGTLIYSFDIVAPDKRIIEVHVDAHSGLVIAIEHE